MVNYRSVLSLPSVRKARLSGTVSQIRYGRKKTTSVSVSEFIANIILRIRKNPKSTDELSVRFGIHLPYLFPQLESVLRIRDILVRIRMPMRILGSVPLANGSMWIREAQKHTRIRNTDTFTHSSKIRSHKNSQNSRNQGFSYYFCLIK
jgi:hypothetical protein